MVIFRSRWLSCLRCCLKACCLLNSVRRTKDHDASSIWMAKGEFLLKKMKCWNEYCSWNFENKMLLLEAEWSSITGDFDQAESLYVRSIATSCSVFMDNSSISACNSITSNSRSRSRRVSPQNAPRLIWTVALQRQNNSAVRVSVLRDKFHHLALVSSPYFIEEPLEIRAAAHLSLLLLKTIEWLFLFGFHFHDSTLAPWIRCSCTSIIWRDAWAMTPPLHHGFVAHALQ